MRFEIWVCEKKKTAILSKISSFSEKIFPENTYANGVNIETGRKFHFITKSVGFSFKRPWFPFLRKLELRVPFLWRNFIKFQKFVFSTWNFWENCWGGYFSNTQISKRIFFKTGGFFLARFFFFEQLKKKKIHYFLFFFETHSKFKKL